MAFANFMAIDGSEVTDQGRTFSKDIEERSVIVELANGLNKKYVKSIKNVFNFTWDYLPNLAADTHDVKEARNTLASKNDGLVHTLALRETPGGAATNYTVFVTSYNEEILRRDFVGNRHLYRVTITFTEQ